MMMMMIMMMMMMMIQQNYIYIFLKFSSPKAGLFPKKNLPHASFLVNGFQFVHLKITKHTPIQEGEFCSEVVYI